MSYLEQAKGINEELLQLFNSINIKEFTPTQRENILNLIIRFGQVCKFRCRNNSAYDTFVGCCFSGIAETRRVQQEGSEWKTLRANYKGVQE
jgi:hypothetical protein